MSLDEPNMLVLLVATITLQTALYAVLQAIPARIKRHLFAWLDRDATSRQEKMSGP
jgi:hypothetical protein